MVTTNVQGGVVVTFFLLFKIVVNANSFKEKKNILSFTLFCLN